MRTLRAQGREARGLDVLPSPYTDVVGSITDRRVAREAMGGVDGVFHTATLHKPHVATHDRQAFIDTNVTGTLTLLEAAVAAGVSAFVFTSTTSTFGDALKPDPTKPAAWITEETVPVPKNIYGVTKVAAEDLCALAHRSQGLPCIVLRTSRFFPEEDDDPEARGAYDPTNLKVNELLYRRADVEDMVGAHLTALGRARAIGFARYIVSATTPFLPEDVEALRRDAPSVVRKRVPDGWQAVYEERGWRMLPSIDRVYDNRAARAALGWQPRHDFASVVSRLASGGPFESALAAAIGAKGYHR
jgi:UDP-glucose 4-epimerase